ncbi:MAG: SIR2 family protein, partial [Mesorhizobium sp.]
KLVFTRRQYAEARANHPNAYRVLESLLISNCFLFIGCGLNDPDLILLLENYRFFHSYAASHYFILPKKVHGDTIRMLKETRNLHILQYDKRDDHVALTQSLEKLTQLAETARVEIARNASW